LGTLTVVSCDRTRKAIPPIPLAIPVHLHLRPPSWSLAPRASSCLQCPHYFLCWVRLSWSHRWPKRAVPPMTNACSVQTVLG
jgi:hypothetical protein